jgi:hypothetical protein
MQSKENIHGEMTGALVKNTIPGMKMKLCRKHLPCVFAKAQPTFAYNTRSTNKMGKSFNNENFNCLPTEKQL